MRLHRELSLVRSKPSTEEAAKDLRELIDYRQQSVRLAEDDEIKRCLGTGWRGVDSDLTLARRVAEWAAEVFDKLAGEGDGRSEAREILLHGEIQRLDEIRRVAEALPSDWRMPGTEPKPADARERAARLEELAEGLQEAGLDDDETFASAVDLATLIDEYRSLTAEAAGDDDIALVFPSKAPDFRTLDMVRMLTDTMSALDLTDDAWSLAASFLAHAGDVEESSSALREAFISASDAWRACVESLQLDKVGFLDGGEHEATGLEELRKRAQEARDAQDSGIRYHHVADGLAKGGLNRIEAERTAPDPGPIT